MTGRRILFATAEFAPLARVGGLAEATAGLVNQLRADGIHVDVVLPDYGDVVLDDEEVAPLDVAPEITDWAGTITVRRGTHAAAGPVVLIGTDSIRRPNPYVDADGAPWPDNDARFFAFSAAVAAVAAAGEHDVLHLNDWHTAAAVGFAETLPPTVLTIHTLGYQGISDASWAERLPHRRDAFAWFDGVNPLVAAIRTVDRIIAVSPTYAREMTRPETGAGVHEELAARGDALVGIRNGIDTGIWDPSSDPAIARRFGPTTRARATATNRAALLDVVGLAGDAPDLGPVIGVVSRLVDQKGIDLLADCLAFAPTLPARFVVLGAGQAVLAERLRAAADADAERVAFVDGYDADLAHQIFAGADLFVMPSRFEPCGLAQMQAMAYGTLPIVTDVGGLHDTVLDADQYPESGTGIVIDAPTAHHLADGLHRAVRLWNDRTRRRRAQTNAMGIDWSWASPAAEHQAIYAAMTGAAPPRPTSR